MVSGGVDAIELAIQHVGHNRQRVPVGRDGMRECPLYPIDRDPARDIEISVNICSVVEINELVSKSLTEHDPNEAGKPGANKDNFPDCGQSIVHCLNR